MKIPRVVLDTNVVVSAALATHGLPARLITVVATGKVSLYLSEPTIQEYAAVLARPKFARIGAPYVRQFIGLMVRKATLVAPRTVVAACPDEDDNRFLECAEAGRAHYLVTGNRRHFPERWKMTRVVTPREFFEAFDPGGELG
jgi:putative PIN family toxin of toxin-antitoxin system